MFEISATTLINAPIETVWQTIMAFNSYKEWSTMLHYLGGEAIVGKPIQLRLVMPSGTDYKFSPQVIDVIPNKRFAWKATTFVNGVFDGEHSFDLSVVGNQTQLVNHEVYKGILSPIFKRLPMMKDAPTGFEAMNQEIKARAEAQK